MIKNGASVITRILQAIVPNPIKFGSKEHVKLSLLSLLEPIAADKRT